MRPAWVEVDLDAVRANVRATLGVLRGPTQLMAVVKADAYGHGAVPVARAALEAGATWLGVALPEEALQLRGAGLDCPVLVFGFSPPEAVVEGASRRVSFTVFSHQSLRAVVEASSRSPVGVTVHLKVDTGMTRVGFPPEEAVQVADLISQTPGLHLEGVYTHFASADTDRAFTEAQLRCFLKAVQALRARGHHVPFVHAANSAATFSLPVSHLDLVRVGIALYGLSPGVPTPALRPAMRVVARAVQVRRVPEGTRVSYGGSYRTPHATTIVTVPVGYADGLPRGLSNRGFACVQGQRVPYAGTVCMDFLMLDVGDLHVEEGEEVELLGSEVPAAELAGRCGTIAYEMVARIGPRLPRVYRGA
ncbi:MAG: alanine racemase [candidate division GAL15 bacterium]